jgi:signal transduction histidine kinase
MNFPERIGCIPDDSSLAPALLDAVETAFWIYDFDAGRIVWANRAALHLWDAKTLAGLRERALKTEMSVSVRTRLAQHREDFDLDPAREIREFWTLYPDGAPFRVRATLRRFDLDDGSLGMLVEARPEDQNEPTTIRSADALLHTKVITALFASTGDELYANPAFREAFGPGRHRFGASFWRTGDLLLFEKGLREAGLHRATVRVSTTLGDRWHDIHAVRCRDAVTSDGAFLISAVDVTEAREQQVRLADALRAAQAADRSKSQFLASMSHEMRTPLNGVLGMASILGNSELTASQRRALEVIARSGQDMLTLVEDMLDIVSLDARTVALTALPYDPVLLLNTATEAVRPVATRKGLTITVDTKGLGAGPFVQDASRLRQVLGHLLSNAVKFTDAGSIVVRVRAEGAPDGTARLRYEVSDTGPGVPEEEQDRIFERFHQLDSSATRQYGGTGLGLAICKEIVALWGGRIGVESGDAGGSVFWFDTPSVLVEAQEAEPITNLVTLRR